MFLVPWRVFIAEECRSAGGDDLQFSNSLPSSAASEGQPEKEQTEAAMLSLV